MKFNRKWLWLIIIIPIIMFTLFWLGQEPSPAVSTVLLAIKGAMTDGNLVKFSGVTGVGEDAGVAALNVTKNKFDATTAPTVNNDIDEGYTVGSKWYDVTADKGYVCMDNTDGAAVWFEITSQGTTTFTGLTDTPANYSGEAGKYAKVNVGENALEFDTPAGTTVFTGLTDTPANYTGEGGKYVKVNVGEDALEFGTVSGESNTVSNIGSQIEIFKQKTGVDFELRTLKAENSKTTVSNTTDDPVDVGPGATNRGSTESSRTQIDFANPANVSGTIDTVEIWANTNLSNCEVATFYVVSGNFLSTRATHTIGSVTSGSKRTFSGLSLSIEAGDYIGIYYTSGTIEKDISGGAGTWQDYDGNDYIPCTNHEFSFGDNEAVSIYAYGTNPTTHDYIMVGVVETEMDVMNLLSTTTVAFNADADTTLYTVPAGKRCVLSHAIVVAADDAGATTTVSIGANGSETDFIPANTLSNLDAQYDSVILQPIPNTTPLKTKSYAAATVIEARVASQSGAAGNTIYLFGITY